MSLTAHRASGWQQPLMAADPRCCLHGSLARKCEICDRDEEIWELSRQLAGAVDALEWIERYTSDRGDAKYEDPGHARTHIHRRASAALEDKS